MLSCWFFLLKRVTLVFLSIREVARAQEEAGRMLERTPVAVTIRLAEASAAALGKAGSLVCAPDLSANTLLGLIGAAKLVGAPAQ